MEAPPSPKRAAPPASFGTGAKGRFYLQARSKVGILGVSLTLMIAASVYSVLQPVSPDPHDISLFARLWYPRETNPYARLQGVRCANDYACRLNGVAVSGTGELPEVWAVGNVGLVLHRKAGQTKWEQPPITATEEKASNVPATPTPTPLPKPAASPSPTPVVTLTPAPAPAPGMRVPDLRGLRLEDAREIAAASRFQLDVEYEGGRTLSPVQQGPPPDDMVVKQSPEAGTLAPAKSTIKVTVGRRPPSKASWIDKFGRHVYAAEPERRQQNATQDGAPGKASLQSSPPKERKRPAKVSLVTRTIVSQQPALGASSAGAGQAQSQPSDSSGLKDDLIYIACDESKGCRALGRSGRIYNIGESNEWSFIQASFTDSNRSSIDSLYLGTSSGWEVLAQTGTTTIACPLAGLGPRVMCTGLSNVKVTKNGDLVLGVYQLPKGPTVFELKPLNWTNNSNEGFLVGDAGFIAKIPSIRDFVAAKSSGLIEPRSSRSGTTATLRSASFEWRNSPRHGFIVGDHGIVLSSSDGGDTWRHETQGPEGAGPNHRLPALWYWLLASLLIAACSAVVAIPAPPPPSEFSVADWTVTDAPLKPGDVDSLGFTPMALGLSRFIRNPKTQPPVTIAIEGEWGEGKSSVMALLRGDLEKSRFRPVWFNAWHHQSEEQLLASLLEHIKDQAVPPWWHIDNWIFRARLVGNRFHQKWPLLIALAFIFFAAASFEVSHHSLSELAASPQTLIPFMDDISHLIHNNESSGQESSESSRDLHHLGLLASALAILAALRKTTQAFGFDSSKLMDNLRNAATIKDIKSDPGIRPRFAREFGDVCKAWSWGGRRVIIFIDDLDRCRPESVVTVMESINFLTTAGDCMIVLGMAQNQVMHCIGLGFQDIAHAEAAYLGACNTEHQKALARFKYGALYTKKLVNIVAPLPKTTPEQRRLVLEAMATEVRRQAEDEEQQAPRMARWREVLWDWASQAGSMTLKAAPILALLLVVGLALLIGYNQGIQPQPLKAQLQAPPNPTPSPAPTPQSANGKVPVVKALEYHPPTSQQATLVEPDKSAGGAWSFVTAAFFLLIIFGVLAYQLGARTNQDAQNSPEFEESLKLWGQYIVGVCDTPREIKRALNDLRYQAMTRRTNGPSTTRGERLIRAMRQFVTGRVEKISLETRVDEAALPPYKAADLAALSDDDLRTFLDPDKLDMRGSENLRRLIELKRAHMRRFHRWIGEVKLASEPTGAGSGSPPPAQIAQA